MSDQLVRRYALTRDDQVFVDVLAVAGGGLYLRAVTGRWEPRCDSIQSKLDHYGLGRN